METLGIITAVLLLIGWAEYNPDAFVRDESPVWHNSYNVLYYTDK